MSGDSPIDSGERSERRSAQDSRSESEQESELEPEPEPNSSASQGGNETENSDHDSTRVRQWAWWLAVLSPTVVPWVFVWTTSATLVFPWGMVTVEGWHVTSLPAYLEATNGLPQYLEMWPLGTVCYILALVWAAGERFGGDQRVTAGLLVLAAITTAWVASGLGVEINRTAVPTGSLLLFGLAVWAFLRA